MARIVICFLCAAVLLSACSSAPAAEYVVTPAGNDASLGAAGMPFKTISRGLAALAPGDVLTIGPGVYSESCVLSVRATEAAPVVVRAASGAVIEAAGGVALAVRDSTYVTIAGLQLAGASRAGIAVSNCDRVTIEGCAVAECGGYGVYALFSDHTVVSKCEISGTRSGPGAFFSACEHPAITDCKISGNSGPGIWLTGAAVSVDSSAPVAGASPSASPAASSEGPGVASPDGVITRADISRNILSANGADGSAAVMFDGVEKSLLENNVLDKNLGGGILSCRDKAAKAGSSNRFLRNVVRFEKGRGAFGVKLANGATKASLEQTTVEMDGGPMIVADEASARGLTLTFNFYATLGAPVSFSYKGETLGFDAWRAATGQDGDSHVAAAERDKPGRQPGEDAASGTAPDSATPASPAP